jgi:hypothetical protein
MSRLFNKLAVYNGPILANQIDEYTANNGVSIDGVTVKDSGITLTALKLSTGAVAGLYLQSDNAGNASWASLSSDPIVEIPSTPYTITSTPQGRVFLANPSTTWNVYLPELGSATYGAPIRIHNMSATNSIVVNRSGSNTIWNDTVMQVTVPPGAQLSLVGGTANYPLWLSA